MQPFIIHDKVFIIIYDSASSYNNYVGLDFIFLKGIKNFVWLNKIKVSVILTNWQKQSFLKSCDSASTCKFVSFIVLQVATKFKMHFVFLHLIYSQLCF